MRFFDEKNLSLALNLRFVVIQFKIVPVDNDNSTAYNLTMKNLIPQVIVETPSYLHAVEDFWDEPTQIEFKNYIGINFLLGDIIPDTGGIRKIRWKSNGKDKRCGARVIYYFYDEQHPIYLLFAYTKNVQVDLTEQEKKLLRSLVQQLKNSFSKET